MKKNIWTQSYNVNTFLVNPQKKLGLFGLLNLFQDTAWIHATHLGHGYEAMIREGTAWVLTRQKLEMHEWPRWGEDITLKTWIRPLKGMLAIRDFEVYRNDSRLGACSTQWLILDLATRKPSDRIISWHPDECLADAPMVPEASKVSLKNDLQEVAQFHVRNSDLDLNGHVNNTRYAQWILDSIAIEKHREFILKEYEVNFIAETRAGDVISILNGPLSADKFQFQGVRISDGKVVFAATLKVSA